MLKYVLVLPVVGFAGSINSTYTISYTVVLVPGILATPVVISPRRNFLRLWFLVVADTNSPIKLVSMPAYTKHLSSFWIPKFVSDGLYTLLGLITFALLTRLKNAFFCSVFKKGFIYMLLYVKLSASLILNVNVLETAL